MSSKNCKKWKRQFDTSLNTYVTDIINYCNINYSSNELKSNNYKLLSTIIKNSGYSINLGNMLIQIKQTGNEECLEYILNKYYVHIMRPAYHDYMNKFDESIDFYISFEIILRLVKDQLFGQFQFGTKKTMNQTILLHQREINNSSYIKGKIKKSVNYDCIESLEFLLDFTRRNTLTMITNYYIDKKYNKDLIKELDKHVNKILNPNCLNLLLQFYPQLQEVLNKYNRLDDFFQDSETFLRILRRHFN
jgi:hypothetical protein